MKVNHMTTSQITKLCRLNQVSEVLKPQQVLFVRFLSGQSDDYKLNVWETDTLNGLYLDHKQAIKQLEKRYL